MPSILLGLDLYLLIDSVGLESFQMYLSTYKGKNFDEMASCFTKLNTLPYSSGKQ